MKDIIVPKNNIAIIAIIRISDVILAIILPIISLV